MAVLALVTARAAWSAMREQRVDRFAADWTATGHDTGECPCAPSSGATSEVQLTKPLPVLPQGPAMVWPVVLANGGRRTSTGAADRSYGHVIGWNGDLAGGLHSGKTWWAFWQPSNGAPFKHVALRTLSR